MPWDRSLCMIPNLGIDLTRAITEWLKREQIVRGEKAYFL